MTGYPRDLVGYAGKPPHPRWPGDARIAVQFVLNYEEGGENCVLHGDAGSEQFLSELFNPASYPDRHLSMESVYEYGSRVGVWRILREFEKRGLPLTVFGVSMALERHPELTAAFLVVEHELHGDLRFAGPLRVRRRAAVADEVARVGCRCHRRYPPKDTWLGLNEMPKMWPVNDLRSLGFSAQPTQGRGVRLSLQA